MAADDDILNENLENEEDITHDTGGSGQEDDSMDDADRDMM